MRVGLDLFAFSCLLPDVGCGAPARQDVKAHGAEITMSASEAGFYDKVKTNLIQRLSTCSIVEPAKRNRRFLRLPHEIRGEHPLLERGREAAPLSPSRHRPCLLRPIMAASVRIEVLSVDSVITSISCRTSITSAGS